MGVEQLHSKYHDIPEINRTGKPKLCAGLPLLVDGECMEVRVPRQRMHTIILANTKLQEITTCPEQVEGADTVVQTVGEEN
jgi:hypothetical protein